MYCLMQVYPVLNGNAVDSVHSDASMKEDAQSSYNSGRQGYVWLNVTHTFIVLELVIYLILSGP